MSPAIDRILLDIVGIGTYLLKYLLSLDINLELS